ncbi:NAD(P)H-binding protein [Cellulomonas shaoxiangyii]|uniref:NmrA family transcriptional regulator n=1 Tax=Cellulomonas shaoxiangyii TaxID=2566013 RepID=A0A4P7SHB0_9CELL|nr:NAD(P)H-binding protein [Cellulomonas shaoxiangyii]QCB93599.1 NmrA family transcriptional regulator [Cellulomonas shaoxiangyii]TGY85696.1 NmrA family transcriptional regulator [Cellulomonas shaoxiangyii]
MRIVVATPTGLVGSRVVARLHRAGVRPVLLVRDPGRLTDAVRGRSEVLAVDLLDVDSVVRATRGADALHWVAPSTGPDPLAAYDTLGSVAATAVRENGIGRVVLQSSVGAEARRGFGEIDGLGRAEEHLDATDAAVTHLRCGYFFSNLLMDLQTLRAGVVTTQLEVDRRIPWVAPDDVADVAALRLLSTGWTGRTTQGVLGPADLSAEDVAATLAELTGRPFRAEQVPDEAVAEQLRAFGMTQAQVDATVGMARGFRSAFRGEDPRDAVSTTTTTFRAWAADTLVPALGD